MALPDTCPVHAPERGSRVEAEVLLLLARARAAVGVEAAGRLLADRVAAAARAAAVPVPRVLDLVLLVAEAARERPPLVRVRREALAIGGPRRCPCRRRDARRARSLLCGVRADRRGLLRRRLVPPEAGRKHEHAHDAHRPEGM